MSVKSQDWGIAQKVWDSEVRLYINLNVKDGTYVQTSLRRPGQHWQRCTSAVTWRKILRELEVVRAKMEIASTILGDKHSKFGWKCKY
jgi:hypothetical protein